MARLACGAGGLGSECPCSRCGVSTSGGVLLAAGCLACGLTTSPVQAGRQPDSQACPLACWLPTQSSCCPPLCHQEENAQLWRNLEWAKGNAPSHPHPEGPAGGIASRMVHPVVGVVDKVGGRWLAALCACTCAWCVYVSLAVLTSRQQGSTPLGLGVSCGEGGCCPLAAMLHSVLAMAATCTSCLVLLQKPWSVQTTCVPHVPQPGDNISVQFCGAH